MARECIFPSLPQFEAALTNVDPKRECQIKPGGDYRSGRQARWRFDVRDERGRPVRVKGPPSPIGGGRLAIATLKAGEFWSTVLSMDRYIDLDPGDYTVRIQYHESQRIADLESVGHLAVLQSEPFPLHVQPRVIDLTRQDREEARN
jgi:hypothetical protein